jgi:pimeloyl-ACP methyl ester carboxylesterase
VPELERRGHVTVAPDLPVDDPDSRADAYATAVAEAIGEQESVVVGHSMMGLAIPLVPARAPVSRLVFLCAFVPEPGSSFNEVRGRERVEAVVTVEDPEFTDLGEGLWMLGFGTATQLFFDDVDPDLAAWAYARLRPQAYGILDETTPLDIWPDVPCSYILARHDRTVDADWARRVAREKLGTTAVEIDGGHSPFLTRPAELADLLHQVVS